FLRTRQRRWDALALASAEIGVVFTTLVLLTGPLWAKVVWGVFWVWDARLTTTLILWLIYVAYLMLRSSAEGERRQRFAAVLGIVGFLDVPLSISPSHGGARCTLATSLRNPADSRRK
ncbi:MAG: cytochrome c biogenesis protein, partial [Chloroflexi bacterium]|nr:cytochrome c biogenesis protein [Chloroflexota bacterium]